MGQLALAFVARLREMAAEAGRLRSVAMARAEIVFDIGDSIVERAFDGSHLIACGNAVGCAVTTITECHFSALKKDAPGLGALPPAFCGHGIPLAWVRRVQSFCARRSHAAGLPHDL